MSALPKEVLFASTNRGKIAEMKAIASPLGVTILDPRDFESKFGPIPDVTEGDTSYRENAHKKAQSFYNWSHLPSLADDTGLEVDALSGAPGVKSARFAGETATMSENKQLLLSRLESVSDRSARFRCILCLVCSQKETSYSEATLEGEISLSEAGSGGFGYDTLFVVEETGKTLSELKDTGTVLTHRARAFRHLYGF